MKFNRIFYLLCLTFLGCRDTLEYVQEVPLGYIDGELVPRDNAWRIPHWTGGGVGVKDYKFELDTVDFSEGEQSACIQSDGSRGYAALMCVVADPDKYRNRRLEVTASLKTDLKDDYTWAGLWLRTDHGDSVLEFDDMSERKIRGKGNWKDYSVSIDVSQNATSLVFGALLRGSGKLWIDNVRFKSLEVIDTQLSGLNYDFIVPPQNLMFEDTM